MVEAAFTLPVLILMLLGGVQFGLEQHSASSMSAALEQGARALVLDPTMTESELETTVLSHLGSGIDSKVSVSLSTTTTGDVTVATITGAYTSEIGLPALATLPFNMTRVVTTPIPAPAPAS